MNAELKSLYLQCRAAKPFMLVGSDAKCSLEAARTILAFRHAEADGLVRLRKEEEQESYLDVYGDSVLDGMERNGHPLSREDARKDLAETLERDGVWVSISEWFDGDEWQMADSCGMHTGYRDPLCPFQNCYIVDEMQAALDALNEHNAEICKTQDHFLSAFDFAA